MIFWIIFGGLILISWLVSNQLKSKFKAYAQILINGEFTGKEVAEKMLHDHGIYDVSIISVDGELTDHYNPANKTVNLSPDVYYGKGISAAAVAAHECGHAVQHAQAYSFLKMRTSLVPIVEFSSHWIQFVLLAGVLLINVFPGLLLLGIVLFATTTLFSFITLPVEIDASRKALAWLNTSGLTSSYSHPKAQEALQMAAYTYVIAALTSLATLMYYITIFLSARDED